MQLTSQITNRWGQTEPISVLTEHFPVFLGRKGAAYSHHQQITSLDGRLSATWSNGYTHEDEPGQRMLLATSDDLGETWSEPRVLVDRQPGEHEHGIVTAQGIHVHSGRMVAYFGYYDYTAQGLDLYRNGGGCHSKRDPDVRFHQGTHTGVMVSDDGGETWSGPVNRIDGCVPNLGPQPLSDGRLILPGNMSFPYTDDPFGIEGWTMARIARLPDDYVDDPEGFWKGMHIRGDSHSCCEGSLYETDGGVVHMMLRTDGDVLAVSESYDRGESWSEPMLTAYTDCMSRHRFGRLPDGRFFGLSCPEPGSARTPLVLATSEDGVVFDRHYVLGDEPASPPRTAGYHKSGRYGYPSYHIMGDIVLVIYSISKEDVAVCRVDPGELA